MPTRPPHPCSGAGCRNLTFHRYCVACQTKYEIARGSFADRGYGARHRDWRRRILARDPICRGCNHAESRFADHVISTNRGGEQFDLGNGQGLCDDCNPYKTGAEQSDPTFGRRLREAGAVTGEPAPRGWRHDPRFERRG